MSNGDDLTAQLNALLPQTQCEQCGYKGCLPYAEAMAAGDALYNRCPPGGEHTLAQLATVLQQPIIPLDTSRGVHHPQARVAFIREDECIGCTKCIQACPVDAIMGAAKLMHTVIVDECSGCELCVEPCPVDCIDIIDVNNLPLTPQVRQVRAEQFRARYDNRNERLARLQVERDAKRRARTARMAATMQQPTTPTNEHTLTQAKSRYQTLHRQWKQATAALQRAQKHQPGDYSEQEIMIAQLAEQAQTARNEVAALVEQAKKHIASTGPSLGELKKDAAQKALALAKAQEHYQAAVAAGDAQQLRQLQQALTKLATDNTAAQRALEQAMAASGLSGD